MSGDRYLISDQQATYFLTFTIVDWVDVFTRKEHKHVIAESLNYCIKNKGLIVYAWCLMSNHLHLIARTEEPHCLSDVIRDFKKYTAKKIIRQIENETESRRGWLLNRFRYAGKYDKRIQKYKFWQESNHAICLLPHETWMMEQKLAYIHYNPVKEEIVEEAGDYLYSSAGDYAGRRGLVEVELLL